MFPCCHQGCSRTRRCIARTRRWASSLMVALGAGLLAACGATTGGTEVGNPNTTAERSVTGSVETQSTTSMSVKHASHRGDDHMRTGGAQSALATSRCRADLVEAIDSKNTSASSDVGDDCSFTLSLTVGRAYRFRFSHNGTPVAYLRIPRTTQVWGPFVAVVSSGSDPINLGTVSFASGNATPQHELSEQSDQDDDGIPDAEDSDADGNGILDDLEEDCDLDGVPDSVDEDTSACAGQSGTVAVLFVRPSNEVRFERIRPDTAIGAFAACHIDLSSVTADTFRVLAADGTAVPCIYQLKSSDTIVACRHDDTLLALDTEYTALLSGARCTDGRSIRTRSWSWRTSTTTTGD